MRRTHWLGLVCLAAVVAGCATSADNSDQKMDDHEMGSAPAGSPSSEMHMAMVRMSDEMAKAPMTGDADEDFAAMMIVHHQGAIEMAELEVKHGKNAELKAMAQKMIDMQKQEQVELRKIVSR
ncbi:MAG: DUF305 domain-containing protein [Armatimonadota bacterium]|nr:DUF305 domain-containing protein [Armatimonadota bacterium]